MSSKQKSMPAIEIQSAAELYCKDGGGASFALVEAHGDDQLRVKLCYANGDSLPAWREGTVLQCVLEAADGRYHSEGVLLKRSDEILWLHMPPFSTRIDRRKAPRITGGFPVNYRLEGGEGIAVCLDISETGMRLRLLNEVPASTKLDLYFTLPGDPMPIRTQAVVIQAGKPLSPNFGVDAGVKFAGLPPEDRLRIARHTRPGRIQPPVGQESAQALVSRSIQAALANNPEPPE